MKKNNIVNGTATYASGYLGGFVGSLHSNQKAVVTFKKNSNDGDINATTGGQAYCGGMIGRMELNGGLLLTVEDWVNNGSINGTKVSFAGGLIGKLLNNKLTTDIRNANNNGAIFLSSSSDNHYGGGLLGSVEDSDSSKVSIIGGINNGDIFSSKTINSANVGGLIGLIGTKEANVTLSRCFNTGNLNMSTNDGAVGGLVGFLKQSMALRLWINDSGNTGALDAAQKTTSAGGLFVASGTTNDVTVVEIYNSFNKGPISGNEHVYGIGNLATAASNVVGMGTLSGQTEDIHSFWPSCNNAALLYGLDSVCTKCENATLFSEQADGMYCLTGQDGCMRVDDELNKEVIQEQYEMMWTMELGLAEPVSMVVGAPYSMNMKVAQGDTVQHAFEFYGKQLDGFIVMDRKTWTTLSNTSTIEENMDIAMCHEVIVRNLEDERWVAEHGKTLGTIAGLNQHLDSRHMGVDATNTTIKYDHNTMLTRNIVFDLAWKSHVVIDIPPADPSQVNTEDILRDVLGIVGGNADGMTAEARTNADGLVERVDIFVFEEDVAHDIANKVNDLDKGASCTAGVLCKSKGARVVYGDPSSATRTAFALLVLIVSAVVLFS